MTHCFIMQTPAYPRPFMITDAAINISPDLDEKADIVRTPSTRPIFGVEKPRVAILAAVEKPQRSTWACPRPSTPRRSARWRIAGQITGAVLDGPLAFDNAIPRRRAHQGHRSPGGRRADILVVPDLEAGNMLAKQLEYLGGARAPASSSARACRSCSRAAPTRDARVASCGVALVVARCAANRPLITIAATGHATRVAL